MAAAGDQVIVKREATNVEPPHKYKVTLSLEPIRSVTLTAPFDGIVRQMDGKPNSKVQAQTDIVRLDNTIAKLKVVRAEAALKIALAEQKKNATEDDLGKALAQSKVDLAKADVDIAKYLLEQGSVRAPFAGEVQRLLVTEGQFVKAGDPLAIVVDNSKLRVEVPAERSTANPGKTLPLKIESTEVEAKVDTVLPLDARFGALRDVFDSVASAVLIVDNADGKFKPGQSAYVPLIPRQPVAEVPSSAVGNIADGQRKVQVVRHGIVRDIPILLMGSVGVNRVFVSGAFAEGDEVIYELSHQLGDGFQLKSSAAATTAGKDPANPNPTTTTPATPTKPSVGF
ncbi:MAG TPA: HlyD family efflux transporter periplasmic adaptor subunit [Schlesneria sp.]|jgi:RND family efflux transporter MFP subunit